MFALQGFRQQPVDIRLTSLTKGVFRSSRIASYFANTLGLGKSFRKGNDLVKGTLIIDLFYEHLSKTLVSKGERVKRGRFDGFDKGFKFGPEDDHLHIFSFDPGKYFKMLSITGPLSRLLLISV